MSALPRLRHRTSTALGNLYLRWERASLERKVRAARPHPHLGPPLASGPRLKELIGRHYLRGRTAAGAEPVAWVTSGGPVEPLIALGFHVHYPENHGAVCGIRRAAQDLCAVAEDGGWSQDTCSYFRTDVGALRTGRTPVGRLPRPDLLVCCTNICQTVLGWYQVIAEETGAPLVVVDTPFLYGDLAPDHALAWVRRQVEDLVTAAERVAGRDLPPARLSEVTRLSRQACDLWLQVLETARHRPAPFTAFDAFIHLAPIVEMRGHGFTVDYYATLLAELEARVQAGVGAVREERLRLAWDNLPIWYRVRWLSELLAARGATLVASTYTQAWGELAPLVDPEHPLDSAARVYLHPILNRSTGHKLRVLEAMARDYAVDGVLLHSDRSCVPYSVGQADQRDRLRDAGIPALLLEADHNDPRAFAEGPVTARLEAFLELVEARR